MLYNSIDNSLMHDSGSNCIRGFPDIPVSEVGGRTRNTSITTLLIPEMNFTHNASIVGFIVAGRRLYREPYSQIQIWRKNSSQNSTTYYQTGHSVTVHVPLNQHSGGACAAVRRIVGDTFWCVLQDNLQITVQAGDILGLVLPSTNDNGIFFTNGGPINYVLEHHGQQLGSNINFSHNGKYATAQ